MDKKIAIRLNKIAQRLSRLVSSQTSTGTYPKCGREVELTRDGLISYHSYKNPLGEIQNCPGSQNEPTEKNA